MEVERTGPFLKFSKISNGPSELWACLKFPSYESQSRHLHFRFIVVLITGPEMVLFFCSFLALRSEDTITEITKISDSEMHNEKELFGG